MGIDDDSVDDGADAIGDNISTALINDDDDSMVGGDGDSDDDRSKLSDND